MPPARRLAKRGPIGLCVARVAGHRMATSPRPAPGSLPPDGGPGGRLHIHGITEMPAGYDAEVAELFRDLRSASGLSEADLAAQLATRTEVVQALEQGALYALPPWPETYRVVATYGTLLNLDVRPLLQRIYAQVDAGVVGLAPKSMPDVPFMAPPENVEREYQAPAATSPASGRLSPSPCRRSQPAPAASKGRRKPRRTGEGRPRRLHNPRNLPKCGLSLSLSSRRLCRISSNRRPGRRSKEERRRGLHRGVAPQPPQPPQSRTPPGPQREARVPSPAQQPQAARRCRCRRRRPGRETGEEDGGRGRQSSNGAWLPSSSWGSPPDCGCGLPSLVPARLRNAPGSQAPKRRTRTRQPLPTPTIRGAGRPTAFPAPHS